MKETIVHFKKVLNHTDVLAIFEPWAVKIESRLKEWSRFPEFHQTDDTARSGSVIAQIDGPATKVFCQGHLSSQWGCHPTITPLERRIVHLEWLCPNLSQRRRRRRQKL